TVSEDDLARLKGEREAADARYNAALTAVDAAVQRLADLPHPPPGPDEHQVTPLNQQFALLGHAPAGSGWKGRLAAFVWRTMQPAVAAQQQFNAALVDHVNRSIPRERAVTEAIAATIGLVRRQVEEAAHFQSMLVVYLQTLTPYVDTKDYEFSGLARRTAEDAQVAIVRLQDIARGLAAATSGLSDEMLKRYESLLGRDQRSDARLADLATAMTVLQQTSLALSREIARGLPAAPASAGAATSAPANVAPAPTTATDTHQQMLAGDRLQSQQYAGFEDLFRGSESEIRQRMADYLPIFAGAPEVVDIGCGRGEVLELLRSAGITARGVDLNHEMVERSRAKGFDVTETEGLSFVAGAAPGSVGGLIACQVVEHLQPDYLLRFLAAAAQALRPGAAIVLETINPACWSAFFDSYVRDLTHVRPVHPDTLKFLVMAAGFTDVTIQWRSPYPEPGKLERLPAAARAAASDPALPPLLDVLDRNVDRLNGLFFTHRDYAIVARRP
ncbi:MAG: class I SAM-dependent methyltransferase, partial [Acidobacteria bacterium]|nr:class I SAM-dependent methyltransferase [Acidobacteriota bacterium]